MAIGPTAEAAARKKDADSRTNLLTADGETDTGIDTDTTATTRAEASSSRDVDLPTRPADSGPAANGSASGGTERAKKGKAKSARPPVDPALRELLRLARDNFSAFERPPTRSRRRGASHVPPAPSGVRQSQPISAAGDEASLPTPSPAGPSSATPPDEPKPGPTAEQGFQDVGSLKAKRRGRKRRLQEPDPCARDSPLASVEAEEPMPRKRPRPHTPDLAATPAEMAPAGGETVPPANSASSDEKGAPPPVAAEQPAYARESSGRLTDGENSKKRRRREAKRPTTELEMLLRDCHAAPLADLVDNPNKRTRRTKAAPPEEKESPLPAVTADEQPASPDDAPVESPAREGKGTKRQREPKRLPTELEMLQRDYYAAPTAASVDDSNKRTRRARAANTTAETASPTATPLEHARLSAPVMPARESAEAGDGFAAPVAPVGPGSATASTHPRKRRAKSRPQQPPSAVRWLGVDHFAAPQQLVRGKRRSLAPNETEADSAAARRSEQVRAAKRAHMLNGAAEGPRLPPSPPAKRRRRAASPELVGPERGSGSINSSNHEEEEPKARQISPELYAPGPTKFVPPVLLATERESTPSERAVTLPRSPPPPPPPPPPPVPTPAAPVVDAPDAPCAGGIATNHLELPRKRERRRPARFTHDLGAPEEASAVPAVEPTATTLSVVASATLPQGGVSYSVGQPRKGQQVSNKPKASRRKGASTAPPQGASLGVVPTSVIALPGIALESTRNGASDSPLPAIAALHPDGITTAAPAKAPKRKQHEAPSVKPRPKQEKARARARHPALDNRESWVEPERDVKLRKNGRPPIWCEGRQELCESLDYFKSYQGGHYDNQERCLGYLLDGFGTANDVCAENGKVVISHGGGCSEVIDVPRAPDSKDAAPQRIFRLKASQTRDNVRMRALFNCKETQTPVVLLAGTQWPFFPRLQDLGKVHEGDAGVRYSVLGHYLVTHIWAEGETVDHPPLPVSSSSAAPTDPDFFVRFRVRFEWVPSQGKPWFDGVIGGTRAEAGPAAESPAPTSPPMSDGLSDAFSLDSGFVDATTPPPAVSTREKASPGSRRVECNTCGQSHPRIYEENVSCYNEACPDFFRLGDRMPRADSLRFAEALVRTTDLPEDSLVPEPLSPRTLQDLAGTTIISDYSEQAWRGFGCSACGRLSSRSDWLRLRCSGCGAETAAKGDSSLAQISKRFGDDWQPRKTNTLGPRPAYVSSDCRVTPIQHVRGYTGYTVELLDGAEDSNGVGHARVHHLWPATAAASRPADELFEAYQGEEAGKLFERNRLTRHAAVGALRTQQFTFNAGAHYMHVIGAETYPFPPTEKASEMSNESAATPDEDSSNATSAASSVESVTYAPVCARDGRDHLTTVVNALKGEKYSEYTQFNEILSVAYMQGGRMNYHDDGERGLGPFVASISLGSDAVMSFRRKEAKKRPYANRNADRPITASASESKTTAAVQAGGELGDVDEAGERAIPTLDGIKRKSSASRVALKIRLKHGDVMLMEGEEMQRRFEHKVEPEGLRFAATARFIGPDHLQPPSKPAGGTAMRALPKNRPRVTVYEGKVPSRFAYQDKLPPSPADFSPVPTTLAGVMLPPLPALAPLPESPPPLIPAVSCLAPNHRESAPSTSGLAATGSTATFRPRLGSALDEYVQPLAHAGAPAPPQPATRHDESVCAHTATAQTTATTSADPARHSPGFSPSFDQPADGPSASTSTPSPFPPQSPMAQLQQGAIAPCPTHQRVPARAPIPPPRPPPWHEPPLERPVSIAAAVAQQRVGASNLSQPTLLRVRPVVAHPLPPRPLFPTVIEPMDPSLLLPPWRRESSFASASASASASVSGPGPWWGAQFPPRREWDVGAREYLRIGSAEGVHHHHRHHHQHEQHHLQRHQRYQRQQQQHHHQQQQQQGAATRDRKEHDLPQYAQPLSSTPSTLATFSFQPADNAPQGGIGLKIRGAAAAAAAVIEPALYI
ncbi:hypothetical protein JCM3774_001180 [Rhodotorula dairenensis]